MQFFIAFWHNDLLSIRNMDKRHFDIRQMESFAAVMSTGSITAAARLTGRSQPAVTRLVQELEADVGFSLLHRSGPRITPTPAGVRFHRDVERALLCFDQMRARADAILQGEAAPMAIAAIPALAAGLIPAALARLGAALPNEVQMQSASAEIVVQSVLGGRAEIGFASLPFEHPGLQTHWIGEAPCVALLAADDPLAAAPTLALAALTGQRLLTMANPFRLRGRVQQALDAAGVAPARIVATNTSLNAAAMVRAGLGIAVVEPATAYGAPLQGVVVRPLDVAIPFLWGVVTPAGQPMAPGVAALITLVQEVAAAILPGFRLRDRADRAVEQEV
jgi:DNA-binding transcriptional LysR family regulator